jgi:hypothetical protein
MEVKGQNILTKVLMVASMKMAVFWVVAACSLVEVDQCFRSAS